MKLLASPWAAAGLGLLVLVFLVVGVTRKAKAASVAPAPVSKIEESQPAANVTAFKELQRPTWGEMKEEGVAKTKLGEPSHQENVKPSDLPAPVSATYLPMRLRHSSTTAASPDAPASTAFLSSPEKKSSRAAASPSAPSTANTSTKNGDVPLIISPNGDVPPKPPMVFAPFGRLIKCELLLTIDSFAEQTPMVGLVTSDLWWNGHLIIPANSEVHGTAKVDRVRDRVISNSHWVVVLGPDRRRPDGTELFIDAIALDRENPQGAENTWGIADGSFGLKGDLISSNDVEKIQAFAAAALSAAAGSLQTRGENAYGEHTSATPRNASLAGTQEVLKQLSNDITDEIRRHGSFLRVPAGKQFYLYVRESISPEAAKIVPLPVPSKP